MIANAIMSQLMLLIQERSIADRRRLRAVSCEQTGKGAGGDKGEFFQAELKKIEADKRALQIKVNLRQTCSVIQLFLFSINKLLRN